MIEKVNLNFSAVISRKELPKGAVNLICKATNDELEEITKQLDVLKITYLQASITMEHDDDGAIFMKGDLKGNVTQACVITLAPVNQELNVPLHIKLYPPKTPQTPLNDYLFLDFDEEYLEKDEIFIGDLLAQYAALALDPYPRHPEAEEGELIEEGEESHKPLHALKKLLH